MNPASSAALSVRSAEECSGTVLLSGCGESRALRRHRFSTDSAARAGFGVRAPIISGVRVKRYLGIVSGVREEVLWDSKRRA